MTNGRFISPAVLPVLESWIARASETGLEFHEGSRVVRPRGEVCPYYDKSVFDRGKQGEGTRCRVFHRGAFVLSVRCRSEVPRLTLNDRCSPSFRETTPSPPLQQSPDFYRVHYLAMADLSHYTSEVYENPLVIS